MTLDTMWARNLHAEPIEENRGRLWSNRLNSRGRVATGNGRCG